MSVIDSSQPWVMLAGILMAIGGFVTPIISRAFCIKPMPRWLREWVFVSGGVIGIRVMTRDNASLDLHEYWIALIWMNIGLAMLSALIWNFTHIRKFQQEKCE